jgi:hypothetical protein
MQGWFVYAESPPQSYNSSTTIKVQSAYCLAATYILLVNYLGIHGNCMMHLYLNQMVIPLTHSDNYSLIMDSEIIISML